MRIINETGLIVVVILIVIFIGLFVANLISSKKKKNEENSYTPNDTPNVYNGYNSPNDNFPREL